MVAVEYAKLSLCVLNDLQSIISPWIVFIVFMFLSFFGLHKCASKYKFISLPIIMTSVHYHLLNFNCAPSSVFCIFHTFAHVCCP